MAEESFLPRKLVRTLYGHVGLINSIRFNEKGTYCMTCGADRTLRLWNPHRDGLEGSSSGLLVKTYKGPHGYDVQDVTIDRDNSKFASCGQDRIVFLWDVASGKTIRKFEGHNHPVNCVKFNDDCSVVLSGSYDRTVRIWDIRAWSSHKPVQILDQAKDSVTSISLTNEEIITGSVDGCIRTYDLRAGMLFADKLHEPVLSISLSDDRKCLLAGCIDSSLRLIEKENGEQLNIYRGHRVTSYRVDCCFSNDGAHVFSGSEDGKVYGWDFVSGKKSIVCNSEQKKDAPVRAIAYHPSETMLLTGSADGLGRVYIN